MQLRMILYFDAPALTSRVAGFIGMCHHVWVYVVGTEPRAPYIVGKHSINQAPPHTSLCVLIKKSFVKGVHRWFLWHCLYPIECMSWM